MIVKHDGKRHGYQYNQIEDCTITDIN